MPTMGRPPAWRASQGPNAFRRSYSYHNQNGDRQLAEIKNDVGGALISRSAYLSHSNGEIHT